MDTRSGSHYYYQIWHTDVMCTLYMLVVYVRSKLNQQEIGATIYQTMFVIMSRFSNSNCYSSYSNTKYKAALTFLTSSVTIRCVCVWYVLIYNERDMYNQKYEIYSCISCFLIQWCLCYLYICKGMVVGSVLFEMFIRGLYDWQRSPNHCLL